MKNYISIALADDPGNGFVDTVEGAVKFIQNLPEEIGGIPGLKIEESSKYIIQAVQMTEEEKNNLPEFQGF